ncbi:amino acid permease [Micromonospora sp. NPDC047707]|uniref:amino acid permease n=1 Tax=unclassified Micromonospora TaxID=2617518 RepID=UPI0012B4E697|nr:amino acid permease [Micromonospora sp. WMMC415]QGN48237.1 amino acid permease [Micromonospora sp. WMMC415]
MSLLRRKSVEQSIRDTEQPEHQLRKELSALDLTVFGVGVIIGTGIFVLTGVAANRSAGPAVALSFVLAGVACALAALCYAEFASTVPVAGSAYTYSYAALGELVAWIIGWDLILEFVLAGAVVAVGWSQYLAVLLETLGVTLPAAVTGGEGGVFNLPATLIVLLLTAVLVAGIKISSRVNAVVVAIKVAVVLFVIAAGLFFLKGDNYVPFVPPAQPAAGGTGAEATLLEAIFGQAPANFGVSGIFAAAALVFFAFIGFDIVATAAEETRVPQRDLPRGILGSLAICTALYVAVSLVVVGMQNYAELDTAAPLAAAFQAVGQPFFANLITLGALAGLTTVVMILMLGQSRVAFAMSRDGLLPRWLSRVHPRYGTPHRITVIVGLLVAVLAGFVPLEELAELVNIGTLFAFVLVAAAVILLRRTRPDLPRGFRVPWGPVIPVLAIVACVVLMLFLTVETWLRFVAWMVLGLFVYFLYSRRNSRLARGAQDGPPMPGRPDLDTGFGSASPPPR